MDLLALRLAAVCVLVNADKERSKIAHYPSTLDVACEQLTPSTCPAHGNWTRYCPREFKVKGDTVRSERFKIKLHKERKTWGEALKVCQSEGGTLAMPKSKKKQNVITRTSKRSFRNLYAWIGMKDVDGNNTYRWIDGESLTYTNWRKGEPNSRTESCVTNTASFLPWNDGWYDFVCGRKRAFICQ